MRKRDTAMATSLVPRLATLRESGDETNGFPPGNKAEDRQSERLSPSGGNFCACLSHKRLKRVEFIRVIRWQRLRGVVCLQRRSQVKVAGTLLNMQIIH